MLRSVTVAAVITACFSSLTSPEIDPEVWAKAEQHKHATSAVNSIRILVALIISILFLNDWRPVVCWIVAETKSDGPENADEVSY